MCGICGVWAPDPRAIPSESALVHMRDALTHRGPDDAGVFLGSGVALGSRRLAILDLSPKGHMPMATEDGRYWITYNGEVYNFQALRCELEARGISFRSRSDTEVVLAALVADGPGALSRFNGMFALAIWDSAQRTLFLARDRLGVKPLYTAWHDGRFYFASEPKALFAAGVPAEFDPDVWPELLCFRYVAGERTVFRHVRRLLPGHWLLLRDGHVSYKRWWNLAERARALRDAPTGDVRGWFRETLDDAVRLRRISDVPVGVLLSGGLDSSSVAASLASGGHTELSSFTVSFDEPGFDEGPLAREIAQRYDYQHHEIRLGARELLAQTERASWIHDEPLAHSNDPHLLAISEYAKPHVTVLLSGEGADETLNGYVRYQPLLMASVLEAATPLLTRLLHERLPARVAKLARYLGEGSAALPLTNACDLFPHELAELGMPVPGTFAHRETVLDEARALYPREPLRQAMYLDQHTFLCSLLDRNDRMTMGASIECRVPFLDYRLVERAAALPTREILRGGQRKAVLRRGVGDRLPASIRRHRKVGFGVPWERYLREESSLRERVRALPDTEPVRSGPISRATLRSVVDRYLAGERRWNALVKELVLVAIWHSRCFPSAGERVKAAS